MMRTMLLAGGLLAACCTTGCNRGSSSPPEIAAAAPSKKSSFVPGKPAKSPEEAVTAFLEAIRNRNEEAARQLLTPVAREKTQNLALLSQPQVTGQARFEVSGVEYLEDEAGAHVASTWTDVDEAGEEITDRVVWILRNEEVEGWRIAGMAMKVFPDQPPVIFNYEDPDDTARKRQLLEEEFARRESAEGSSDGAADADAADADAGQTPTARQADRRSREN